MGESAARSSRRRWAERIFISVKEILLELNEKKNGRLGTKNITLTKSQLALIFARVYFKMADAENQKRYCVEIFSLKTRSTVVFCSLHNTYRLKKYHES